MLFNKNNDGAAELKELTSSYYANNKFAAIRTQLELETEAMIKLIGQALYVRAETHYLSGDFQADEDNPSVNDELVKKIRVPIAYKATLRFYQLNIVSHEDTGRKVKINREHEIMPWEWMVDRDDEAQSRLANETMDLLFDWIERKNIPEWINSDQRTAARKLFVNSPLIFQDAYPMTDGSWRFFYTTAAFNKEVQTIRIAKVLGARYTPLLEYWQTQTLSGSSSVGSGIPSADDTALYDQILALVQKIIPLEVMILAAKRLSLQTMPYGVVQHFKSMFQGRDSSSAALEEVIRRYTVQLSGDSSYIMDDLKQLLQDADPESRAYRLLPENDECKKFFST